MAQSADPDSMDWQRRWTVDAGSVTLEPVTRAMAQAILGDLGTAAVSAFLGRLGTVPQVRDVSAVTGAENVASRRLLEAQGFHLAGELPATAEVRYVRTLR